MRGHSGTDPLCPNQDQLKMQSTLNLDAMRRQQEMQLGGQKQLQDMNLENQRETMRIQRDDVPTHRGVSPCVLGYVITEGKGSDILALTLNNIGVSCANIPAGYYQPHKDDEYTVIAELEKCLSFVNSTINTLDKRFPHIYKSQTQLMAEKELFK